MSIFLLVAPGNQSVPRMMPNPAKGPGVDSDIARRFNGCPGLGRIIAPQRGFSRNAL